MSLGFELWEFFPEVGVSQEHWPEITLYSWFRLLQEWFFMWANLFLWDFSPIPAHIPAMASSTLGSEAAFLGRAKTIGVEAGSLDKLKEKGFASFGKFAFAVPYAPSHADDWPFLDFLEATIESKPDDSQVASLRRLFFESHVMALADVRSRVEATPDDKQVTRKLPTERVARQEAQQQRLKGLVFTPETIPSNHLVDLCVEMVECNILTYIRPDQCCSRSQEIQSITKDTSVSLDSSGVLTIGSKNQEIHCEANTEIRLRAAWQRRSLAFDLSSLCSSEVMELWVQYLFNQLMKDQPLGFSKVTLQQIVECDKQLFILAAHQTMGQLQSAAANAKPLDEVITRLQASTEVLQYLSPLPAVKSHDPPVKIINLPKKVPKNDPKQSPGKKSRGDNPQPPPKDTDTGGLYDPYGWKTFMFQIPNWEVWLQRAWKALCERLPSMLQGELRPGQAVLSLYPHWLTNANCNNEFREFISTVVCGDVCWQSIILEGGTWSWFWGN